MNENLSTSSGCHLITMYIVWYLESTTSIYVIFVFHLPSLWLLLLLSKDEASKRKLNVFNSCGIILFLDYEELVSTQTIELVLGSGLWGTRKYFMKLLCNFDEFMMCCFTCGCV